MKFKLINIIAFCGYLSLVLLATQPINSNTKQQHAGERSFNLAEQKTTHY